MSATKKQNGLDIHYHFVSPADVVWQFRMLAKAKGLSQSQMFNELVNYYWDNNAAKVIPLPKTRQKLRKTIGDILKKAGD